MVTVLEFEDRLVFQLNVDLKMENAREFYEEFMEKISIKHNDILLDFSSIRFVDSSGIGTLIKCTEKAKTEIEGELYMYGLNRSLLSVFKLSGLLKIFTVIEEAEARERFPEAFKD